ncbi:MAG: NAD(+)/NADH kinase [Actinomycetota bacterium]
MTRIGAVVHPAREEAVAVAADLAADFAVEGVEMVRLPDDPGAEPGAGKDELDLVVAVGGDGTFLRAARVAYGYGCPVLGVKVGRMGFLTEVEPDGASSLIRAFLAGDARVEERLALEALVQGAGDLPPQWGLNEVIVEKLARHRLIKLAVRVDATEVATVSADGVIVSTPTGSTAYSFSARGPIVTPTLRCMVVTPVAAHMVFDRSLVIDPGESVTLEVVGEEPGVVSTDGRESVEVPVGAAVTITPAARPALLVRRPDAAAFLELVRNKFGLPGGGG